MEKIKLSKTALNKVVMWSTTKYNDWLGYGSKKENVQYALKILKDGHEVKEIQCASPVGENPHRGTRKYWRTKQSGYKYIVNGPEKSITNINTKEVTFFI